MDANVRLGEFTQKVKRLDNLCQVSFTFVKVLDLILPVCSLSIPFFSIGNNKSHFSELSILMYVLKGARVNEVSVNEVSVNEVSSSSSS